MKRRIAFAGALLILVIGALAFRLPDLGNRPIHGDEAVHAFKFHELWKTGVYRYDANEFHGPTIYYAALPVVFLRGRHTFAELQETDLRLAIVLFGTGLVALCGLLAGGLGRRAALTSAALFAISPAFVFYSRYYIQEMLLAFFTLALIGCVWRYTKSRAPIWPAAAGASAGLMIASKETAVITFVAMGVGLALTMLWARLVDRRPLNLDGLKNRRHLALFLGLALVVACLFVSGFGTNWKGPLDYVRSYAPWFGRAHGTGLHRFPWNYYLGILAWTHGERGPVWSEGLILGMAAVGFIAALLPRRWTPVPGSLGLVRFLAFSTVALTVIYSAIPYKTPWCVLSFLLGMILLAGVGAVALTRIVPGTALKATTAALILAGMVQLGQQAYRTNFVYVTDSRNPYVYAQPAPDVIELGKRVADIARANPRHDNMVIKVISTDEYYWPIPWYLRQFPNVGYYTGQVPADPVAPVVIAASDFDEPVTKILDPTHLMTGYFGLRSEVTFEVFVSMDAWKAYLDTRKNVKREEIGE